MSDQTQRVRASGRQIRVRLQRLQGPHNAGMFGLSEVIAISVSALVVVLVVISYLYFLVPARKSLQLAALERERLQKLLATSRTVVSEGETTETSVRAITDSLDDFENRQLFGRTQGRMGLYDELNRIIRNNALKNTSGPSYTTLEPTGGKNSGASRSTRSKWQSVYPGIAISVTVEGSYANLRRFIRDIEASNLFLIINAVELERATEGSAAATEVAGKPSLVSLRLDMATYFQRSGESEGATQEVAN